MANEPRDIAYARAANFIEDTLLYDGKFIGKLCETIKSYNRKAADMSEKNDKVMEVIKKYSESVFIYSSLRVGMMHTTTCLNMLTLLNNLRVNDIEDGVLMELKKYEKLCSNAKKDAKHARHTIQLQSSSRRELEKIMHDSPRNTYRIRKAEKRYEKDSANVSQLMTQLEEQVISIEVDKTCSLKKGLMEFLRAEMFYHAKALELLQHTYKLVDKVQEDRDIQEFLKKLKIPKSSPEHGKDPKPTRAPQPETSRRRAAEQAAARAHSSAHGTPLKKKSSPERKKESLFAAPLRNIRNFVSSQKNPSPGGSADSLHELPKPRKRQPLYNVEFEH